VSCLQFSFVDIIKKLNIYFKGGVQVHVFIVFNDYMDINMKKTKNPDNRADQEERIKTKINKTMHNAEVANEILGKTNDDLLKKRLIEKNTRRQKAVKKMKEEISED
jgi:small acid-soluble spore protein tlp